MSDLMWNCETPVADMTDPRGFPPFDVPAWIDLSISPQQIAAIVQGGCASGAYMPACWYDDARDTMSRHGDEVLDFIRQVSDDLPAPPNDASWAQMASIYLATAVDSWARLNADDIEALLQASEGTTA